MLWAAMNLCFFGFLRAGEMTLPSESVFDPGANLCYKDVAINDPVRPTLVKVRIKASKTDLLLNGVDIFLGKTGNDLCPSRSCSWQYGGTEGASCFSLGTAAHSLKIAL